MHLRAFCFFPPHLGVQKNRAQVHSSFSVFFPTWGCTPGRSACFFPPGCMFPPAPPWGCNKKPGATATWGLPGVHEPQRAHGESAAGPRSFEGLALSRPSHAVSAGKEAVFLGGGVSFFLVFGSVFFSWRTDSRPCGA